MKNGIFKILDNLDIDVVIDGKVDTDDKALYLYLQEKALIATGNYKELKKYYENNMFFETNFKVLIELLSNKFFANAYKDNLKEAVSFMVYCGRERTFNTKEERINILNCLNELLYTVSDLYNESSKTMNSYVAKVYLVAYEAVDRDVASNKRKLEKFYKEYEEVISNDVKIFELYYLMPKNEKYYKKSLISSALNNIMYLNDIVNNYHYDEIYYIEDDFIIYDNLVKGLERIKEK